MVVYQSEAKLLNYIVLYRIVEDSLVLLNVKYCHHENQYCIKMSEILLLTPLIASIQAAMDAESFFFFSLMANSHPPNSSLYPITATNQGG